MTLQDDELRKEILTEFKQVYKLAPADYTENCTNVVMSIIKQREEVIERKARLSELQRQLMFHDENINGHLLHNTVKWFAKKAEEYLLDRIKELTSPTNQKEKL